MKSIKKFYAIILVVVILVLSCKFSSLFAKVTTVVYSTDIAINGDLDDYFDLVAMNTLEDISLEVIVDGNIQSEKESGAEAIKRLDDILVSKTSYTIGVDKNLSNPLDKGDNSTTALQEQNTALLDRIRKTTGKIDIVSVGSLRDIAIMYHKNPDLFKRKVNNIYVFAGDAEGTYKEYNVDLDETAFLRIMNSELNIYWIPCFQNGLWTKGSDTSYFTLKHEEIFTHTSSKLIYWFLYRFNKENTNFSRVRRKVCKFKLEYSFL